MKISQKFIRKLITLGLIVILFAIFAFTAPSFLKLRNIQEILRVAAYTGIICVGSSFVLIGGGIDLSSGGIICFSGIVACRLASIGMPWPVVLLVAVVIGAACGYFNGWLITRFYLNDFITTLATGFVFTGFGLLAILKDESGTLMSQEIKNKGFLLLGKHLNGFYYIVFVWIILTVIAWFILSQTRYGLHTYAMGSNSKSSEMSGVNVRKMKVSTFTICGACCAVAAVFTVAYQTTAYLNLGSGMGFNAVAACVVGGVMLGGGKGDAVGAFLGAIFMTLVNNGMYKYGLDTSWQYVFQGAVILIAIMSDAGFAAFTGRRLRALAEKNNAEEALLEAKAKAKGGNV
ncbi:MAG: ABC transporter permease [Lachnospiraceae bacterium]|nr:ABC transporter permease [Lachnospiraceae bacterium]